MARKIFKSGHLNQIFTPLWLTIQEVTVLSFTCLDVGEGNDMVSFPFGWSPSGIAYPSLPSKLRLPTPSRLESTGTGRGPSGGWTGKLSQHNYITHHQQELQEDLPPYLAISQMQFKVILR